MTSPRLAEHLLKYGVPVTGAVNTVEKYINQRQSVIENLISRLEKSVPDTALKPFPIGSSLEERMSALEEVTRRVLRNEIGGDIPPPEHPRLSEITFTPVEKSIPSEKPKTQEEEVLAPVTGDSVLVKTDEEIQPGGMVSPAVSNAAIKVLQQIVDEFNTNLEEWYRSTGCVANFSWDYADFKKLSVSGIDYIVYRKKAVTGTTIKEILSKGAPNA